MLQPWDQPWICRYNPRPLFLRSFSRSTCVCVLVVVIIIVRTPCLRTSRCLGLLNFKTSPAFLDWISNNMNIIDSLTLIFLTLSAVKSAHIPKETERGPHDVIPLMEVYNKSLCKPRELLVEILQEYPEDVEHIFIPSCVVLTRCAGCCNDEMLQCMPTSSYNVTMEIKRIKHQRQQNDIFLSFTEHSACECRLKKEVREQRENVCEPCCDHCSERRKRLFVQDPATCHCSCKHTDDYCRERKQELNERTCKCDKPR